MIAFNIYKYIITSGSSITIYIIYINIYIYTYSFWFMQHMHLCMYIHPWWIIQNINIWGNLNSTDYWLVDGPQGAISGNDESPCIPWNLTATGVHHRDLGPRNRPAVRLKLCKLRWVCSDALGKFIKLHPLKQKDLLGRLYPDSMPSQHSKVLRNSRFRFWCWPDLPSGLRVTTLRETHHWPGPSSGQMRAWRVAPYFLGGRIGTELLVSELPSTVNPKSLVPIAGINCWTPSNSPVFGDSSMADPYLPTPSDLINVGAVSGELDFFHIRIVTSCLSYNFVGKNCLRLDNVSETKGIQLYNWQKCPL